MIDLRKRTVDLLKSPCMTSTIRIPMYYNQVNIGSRKRKSGGDTRSNVSLHVQGSKIRPTQDDANTLTEKQGLHNIRKR